MTGEIKQGDEGAPAARSGRDRLSGAARRTRFLDAAAQIVAQQGLSAVTMDGVAAATGVNKRLGYRYFTNRDDLLRALLDRELAEMGRRARLHLPAEPDLELRIAVNIRVWLEMMRERGPLLSRLLFDQDVGRKMARDVNRIAVDDWTQAYTAALDVPPAQAQVAARILLAGLRGAVDALQRDIAPLEEIAAIYTDLAIAGARSLAGRGSPRPLAADDKSR